MSNFIEKEYEMGRFNWGPDGPPDDAYSRVTGPERFRPLHDWTLELIREIQAEFEVECAEWHGPDAELERVTLARPLLKLAPPGDNRAPIIVAFTTFPALAVRFGRWRVDWFPSCGCDACDEVADVEFSRFRELVDCVLSGQFRESLYMTPHGHGWREHEFWSDSHHSKGKSRVETDQIAEMLAGANSMAVAWLPWPRAPKTFTPRV